MANYTQSIVFTLLFLCSSGGIAGGIEKGKYAGEFLTNGAGARALGLGSAYVALVRNVDGVYWNSAALAKINYPQLSLMHAQEFAGIVDYNAAAFALPFGSKATLGVGLIRLGVEDIPATRLPRPDLALGEIFEDEDGTQRRNSPFRAYEFTNAEYGLFFSYARFLSNRFNYGASLKLIHKGFDDNSAWGIGFDLAAQYNAWKNIYLGVNFQDITTTILAWDTGRKEIITPTLKFGLAAPFFAEFLHGRLLPVADVDLRFESRELAAQFSANSLSADLHAGLEYEFQDRFSLRVGSNAGNFTAGAGITIKSLHIDYAFAQHSELDESHRVSLHLTFRNESLRRE